MSKKPVGQLREPAQVLHRDGGEKAENVGMGDDERPARDGGAGHPGDSRETQRGRC
ncbi:hypothetical protein D3C72_2494420 [compost metagenome]